MSQREFIDKGHEIVTILKDLAIHVEALLLNDDYTPMDKTRGMLGAVQQDFARLDFATLIQRAQQVEDESKQKLERQYAIGHDPNRVPHCDCKKTPCECSF